MSRGFMARRWVLVLLIGAAPGGCFECHNPGDPHEGSGTDDSDPFPGPDGRECEPGEGEGVGLWCSEVCVPGNDIDHCGECGVECDVHKVVGGGEPVETVGGCTQSGFCGPLLGDCFSVSTTAPLGMDAVACEAAHFTGEFAACTDYCASIGKTVTVSGQCDTEATYGAQLYDSLEACQELDSTACDPVPDATGVGQDHTDPDRCQAFPRGTPFQGGADECLAAPGWPARWARCCCIEPWP